MRLSLGAKIGLIIGLLGGLIGLAAPILASPHNKSGWLISIALFLIFFICYWVFFRPLFSSNKILKNGIARKGKILQVWDTNVTINNNPQIGLLLEVMDEYNKPYQVKTKQVVSRLSVSNIIPGLPVTVKVDRNNPQKVAIESFGSDTAGATNTANAPAQNFDEQHKAGYEKLLMDINTANEKLFVSGISAQATVLKYYDLGFKVNGNNPLVLLFLQVQPGLKEPFYSTAFGAVKETSVVKYQPGSTVFIKYDVKDTSRVTIERSSL